MHYVKKYDEIITLGQNCELAFKIMQSFGAIESYLFTWALVPPYHIFDALENPSLIFSEEIVELKEVNMWRCSRTDLTFHGKSSVQALDKDEKKRDMEKQEVISRVRYLSDKLQKVLKSDKKKLFAIEIHNDLFKFSIPELILYISKLFNVLNRLSSNFDLLIILGKDFNIDEIKSLQNNHLFIRFVEYFAPYNQATTKSLMDLSSSKKIFKEFQLKTKLRKIKMKKIKNCNNTITPDKFSMLLTKSKDELSLQQNKIKILVSYHKPAILLKNKILTPIHAGRAITNSISKDGYLNEESLQWLINNMIGDDTGDNISNQNRFYNEMTSVYWAWKNQDKLDFPDYIGFMHYRRQFIFQDEKHTQYSQSEFFAPNSQYKISCLSEEDISELFSETNIEQAISDYDLVVTKPADYKFTVYQQYEFESKIHEIKDLDIISTIIKLKYPTYSDSVDEYLNSNKHYFWNMFIMKKDLFENYCQWLFSILDDFAKITDTSSRSVLKKRVFAYLAERLTGIYITYLKKNTQLKISEKWSIFEENTEICTEIKPSFLTKCIPVVFSCDNNYCSYLAAAVKSLIQNSSDKYNYDIFILDDHISEYNKSLIKQSIIDYPNVNIRFIDVIPYLNNLPRKIFYCHGHFSISTYYRFFLPRILRNFDKALYIDCDTVILDDVSKLYEIDLENYVLAATKDVEVIRSIYSASDDHKKRLDYYKNVLKLQNPFNYFQAGVLVFNIKQMLKINFEQQCIDRLMEIKTPEYVDQDILNSLYEDQVKFFDISWNTEWHLPLKNNNIEQLLPQDVCDQYMAAYKQPKIIHYCSDFKPWIDPTLPLSNYFWKYARLTPFYETIIYDNLRKRIIREIPVFQKTESISSKSDNNEYIKKIIREAYDYRATKAKYIYYKFLTKIYWGKKRKRYKKKREIFKEKIAFVRRFMKHNEL